MLSQLASRFDPGRPNRLAATLAARAAAGGPAPVDLVGPAWAACGLAMPEEMVATAYRLAVERCRIYEPDPKGRLELRTAIAQYYAGQGIELSPDSIIVTPGTSLAYLILFRLLCDPGQEILCPTPSYPLFEDLAAAAHARVAGYSLDTRDRFALAPHLVETALSNATRAVCVVSPHNPVGSVASDGSLRHLEQVAARHRLAILFDEVFEPFRDDASNAPLPRPTGADGAPLVFLLNGVSKMLALPAHKIGWIAVLGADSAERARALAALEHLNDALLATSELAQAAVAHLLRDLLTGGATKLWRDELTSTLSVRRHRLAEVALAATRVLGASPAPMPTAGIYQLLPLPGGWDEEATALQLLERHNILTHPGYYYRLPGDHLVMTSLHPADRWSDLPAWLPSCGHVVIDSQ